MTFCNVDLTLGLTLLKKYECFWSRLFIHPRGVEGAHSFFGELCKYELDLSGKGETAASPGTHSYPWNKQTNDPSEMIKFNCSGSIFWGWEWSWALFNWDLVVNLASKASHSPPCNFNCGVSFSYFKQIWMFCRLLLSHKSHKY